MKGEAASLLVRAQRCQSHYFSTIPRTPGYTLYSAVRKDSPRACILARNMDIWALPEFSYRDLVAVLVKYMEDGAERHLVVCSAYLPYDS